MTISTNDLEDRLTSTLRGLDHVSLDSPDTVIRGGGHSGAGRLALGAVVVAALVGSGFAWKAQHRQQEASVVYQAGDWSTPYDNMPAVEWNRGLLEDRLGTSTGSASVAIGSAIASAEAGCTRYNVFGTAEVLLQRPESRTMTQRQFLETYGSGFVLSQSQMRRRPTCGLPVKEIPADVRLALKEANWLPLHISLTPEGKALRQQLGDCMFDKAGSTDPMESVSNELNDNEKAVAAGAYPRLPQLLEIDRQRAIVEFQCKAETRAEVQALEAKHVAEYLADPAKVAHLEAAATFLREQGLAIDS
jgi:hypothetical protein